MTSCQQYIQVKDTNGTFIFA